MIDLMITGGRVVTPSGVEELDVAIEGERIGAVARPGSMPSEGARNIDASGKIAARFEAFAPEVEVEQALLAVLDGA